MTMFTRILVLPATEDADRAIAQRVRSLAGRSTVVEVFALTHEPHLDGYFGHPEIYESLRDRLVADRLAAAERLAAELRQRGLSVNCVARWDAPRHEALARHVGEFGADLVVTALARRGQHLAHGEWRTVAACPVPMLVVAPDRDGRYRNVVAAVDPFHAHGQPAELDTEILRHAQALQQVTGSSLQIVHAYVPLGDFLPEVQLEQVESRDAEQVVEAARREALEQLVASASLPIDAARLMTGRPADVLERLAAESEVDAVVVGAWSRGRLRELFLGSTAERVLERAHADVLVVKPRAADAG